MTWASLLQFPDLPFVPEAVRGGSFAVVMGAFLGDEAEGRELLRGVRDLGPAMDTFAMVPPAELERSGHGPARAPADHDAPRRSSTTCPSTSWDPAVGGPGSGSPLAMVQLRQMGGALARHGAGRRSAGHPARALQPDRAGGARGRTLGGDDRRPTSRVDRRRRATPLWRVPELRRATGRRQRLLRRGHLGAPSGGQGRVRPRPSCSGATTTSRPPRPGEEHE